MPGLYKKWFSYEKGENDKMKSSIPVWLEATVAFWYGLLVIDFGVEFSEELKKKKQIFFKKI